MPPTLEQANAKRETYATVLLSLAAVATAWCAFQASMWDGERAVFVTKSTAAGREAAVLEIQADQMRQIDITTFIQYVNARVSGQPKLAEFYRQRFRPDFRPAFESWLATDPFANPDAPRHPFGMTEYRIGQEPLLAAAHARADSLLALSEKADAHSDHYILQTVLFSLVLFFAGIATKFDALRAQDLMLGLGTLVLLIPVVRLFFLPMTLEF